MLLTVHTIDPHFQNIIFYADLHIKIWHFSLVIYVISTQTITSPLIWIRWKRVVSIKLRPLYIRGNSPPSYRSYRRQASESEREKEKKYSCPLWALALRWTVVQLRRNVFCLNCGQIIVNISESKTFLLLYHLPIHDHSLLHTLQFIVVFYDWVSVHHKSILYKETTRCNFGSIVY
jgi:hypothetical protein